MSTFLLDNAWLYSLCLLSGVVLIKIILSIFYIKEPMHLFRFYCIELAKKVNKQSSNQLQQKTAGVIAALLTLTPLLVILWLFELFIEVQWLWNAFILYFALGSFGLTRTALKTAKALAKKNTDDAKKLIAPYSLRETHKLSSLGLTKTTIELHLLQTIQQCFTVAIIYLLAGSYAALAFRLLLEMHYSWNIKQEKYKHFGRFVHGVLQLIQWLPARFFALILLIGTMSQHFILFWRLAKQHFFSLDNTIALLVLALTIQKRLGGVVMYQGKKLRRDNLNEKALEPEPSDIMYAVKSVNQVLSFSLIFLVFSSVLFILLTLKH